MPSITFTLADARKEVYLRLRGQELADQNVGRANIVQEINFAQLAAMLDIGLLEHAGGLYNSETIAVTSPTDAYPLAANVLLPCYAEYVNGTARYVKSGNLLQISKTPLNSQELCYAFIGTKIVVRPVPTSASVVVHEIVTPTLLSADADALEVAPSAFPAVCMRAAWGCMGHWANINPELVQQMEGMYRAEVARLRGEVDSKYLAAAAIRTGREPFAFGPQSGQ